ncbi:MAG: hypothetical protein MZU97_16390 [Bacillus subtilis]|nr:hypothetical protein [Bacillus subtilis]
MTEVLADFIERTRRTCQNAARHVNQSGRPAVPDSGQYGHRLLAFLFFYSKDLWRILRISSAI